MMELALRCESFCLAFVICVLLTLNTITAHNATNVVYDSQFDQQQVFTNKIPAHHGSTIIGTHKPVSVYPFMLQNALATRFVLCFVY